MKISSKMRVRKPPINADHKAPARVNLTGCSVGVGPTGCVGVDGVGEAGGSLLIAPSLPHLTDKETSNAGNLALGAKRRDASKVLPLVSAV
jgi:hypothetical protein